jgi:hypothetical protein
MKALGLVFAALLSAACHEGNPGPTAGSNSNWLQRCDVDADCSATTACRCGSCTRSCTAEADCKGLGDARCVSHGAPAWRSLCGADEPEVGLCLPRCEAGSCGSGRACVEGACVLAEPPATELCATLTPASDDERARDDELIAAVESMRVQGGVVCGSDAKTAAANALALDARLMCAARAFASDLNITHGGSLTDSVGRSTSERLGAAGYTTRSWGEGFAYNQGSGASALSSILRDAGACRGLTDPNAIDIGVAHTGSVDVITVAAE